jgi:hypothetical protein
VVTQRCWGSSHVDKSLCQCEGHCCPLVRPQVNLLEGFQVPLRFTGGRRIAQTKLDHLGSGLRAAVDYIDSIRPTNRRVYG